ncbi:hypothetical protein [Methylobacterium aquaticum]|uniref:Uncharacterized protein n=1 Tax=Methylobacterium aquaticum TaxID=270351 RepID=A0A0C6FXS3_9HYPH|nr:hypothetical protein [Methylobacterium aquaticum]BAQ50399.1 hypothetical protein Maq22A_4p60230 [Methylobacterium aquaticum]
MTAAIDRAAEARLAQALEHACGDLAGALAHLCAGLSVGDVEGEGYAAALERMIRTHFGRERIALRGMAAGLEDPR